MNSVGEIDKIVRRVQRYWYEDGFYDMGFGGLLIALGLVFLGQAVTPVGSPLWLLWGMGTPFVLIGGGLIVNKVVQMLKERVTFPRTGYVSYSRPAGRSHTLRSIFAALVAAGVSALIVIIQSKWMNWTAILGVAYLIGFSLLGMRVGLKRYLVLGLWCLVLGAALAPLAMSMEWSGAIYHIGVGVGWLAVGWITWQQYMRTAPPLPEANDDAQA